LTPAATRGPPASPRILYSRLKQTMTAKQNAGLNGSSRFTPAAIKACSMEICPTGHRVCADFDWEEGFEAEEIGKPISPVSRLADLTD